MGVLNLPVSNLNKIGKVLSRRLGRLGIKTIRDLLFTFPFRYEDYSQIVDIADLPELGSVTVFAQVEMIDNRRSRSRSRGMMITEAVLTDNSGSLKAVWFNRPFIKKNLSVGSWLYFSGQIKTGAFGRSLLNPAYEFKKEDNLQCNTASMVPVYPSTQNLTQKQIRFLTKQALGFLAEVKDWMPGFIRQRRNLIDLPTAVRQIHYPSSSTELCLARQRLQYDQLFWVQARVCYLKQSLSEYQAYPIPFAEEAVKKFVADLPFELTEAQKKVSWRILRDLDKSQPMNRLVQGDVGSGKTVVAFLAVCNTLSSGTQSVLMAPTEILAKQHYQNVLKLFAKHKINVLLLTAKDKKSVCIGDNKTEECVLNEKQALNKISAGEVDLVVGTHSVIQDKVKFCNLGLVIVDEQHRFGVKQRGVLRGRLAGKGIMPHYLSLTATPIPRSQALFLYGDLDISLIDQMPAGRKKVITKVVDNLSRSKMYEFIRSCIKKGQQCFVVCPLIDPSDKVEAKSLVEAYENLQNNIFPDLKVAFLHGKLKTEQKDKVMRDFKNKQFDILVATSVVEVGVDIPNASVMLVEGADRFGLAQLHQFRGRVGRGKRQSYCFLCSGNNKESLRLKIMETVSDGFVLAQKDLQIRGSGQVYGFRQSGDNDLAGGNKDWEQIVDDCRLVENVRADVFEILSRQQKNGEFADLYDQIRQSSLDIYLE